MFFVLETLLSINVFKASQATTLQQYALIRIKLIMIVLAISDQER